MHRCVLNSSSKVCQSSLTPVGQAGSGRALMSLPRSSQLVSCTQTGAVVLEASAAVQTYSRSGSVGQTTHKCTRTH